MFRASLLGTAAQALINWAISRVKPLDNSNKRGLV